MVMVFPPQEEKRGVYGSRKIGEKHTRESVGKEISGESGGEIKRRGANKMSTPFPRIKVSDQ